MSKLLQKAQWHGVSFQAVPSIQPSLLMVLGRVLGDPAPTLRPSACHLYFPVPWSQVKLMIAKSNLKTVIFSVVCVYVSTCACVRV